MDHSATPNAGELSESTARSIKVRLWVMMFLQYFVQGCYLPIVSVYLQDALNFNAQEVGWFGSALAVGPLIAPFVLGQLVDRHFATQRVLAVCHLAGGAVMLMLYFQSAFWLIVLLGTLYSILYVPSLMLTNSLAFHHLKNRDREFPLIRLWGTIGFILPAWVIEMYWLKDRTGARALASLGDLPAWLREMAMLPNLPSDALNQARGICLWLAGAAGIVMAFYSATLPHTPPPKREKGDFAPGKVFALWTQRHFLVLVLVSFGIAMVHKFYFVVNSMYLKAILETGGYAGWEQRISSIGQIAEVAVMAGLGMTIARFGFKWTLIGGLSAYLLRCLIFAAGAQLGSPFPTVISLACLGQALHGFCFGCFWAAAFMYADRMCPPDARGSMQNLYGTTVFGLGMFVGGFVSGWTAKHYQATTSGATLANWTSVWLACAAIAAVCVLAFAIFFPRKAASNGLKS